MGIVIIELKGSLRPARFHSKLFSCWKARTQNNMIDATEVAAMPDVYWAWIRMKWCMLRGGMCKCNSSLHVEAKIVVSAKIKKRVTKIMRVAEFELRNLWFGVPAM